MAVLTESTVAREEASETKTGKTVLTVEDGKFCINGEPTKLVGFNMNVWGGEGGPQVEAQVMGQLKILSQYGFNAIRHCNAHMILPLMKDDADPEKPPLLGIRKFVEKCDELGMVVMMTPLHVCYFGCGRVREDIPRLFGIKCLNEMYFEGEGRRRFLKVYEHNAKALADYNNIMWAPPNEQNPLELFAGQEYLAHTQDAWIAWLQKKYKTTPALKESWGRNTPFIHKLPDDWKTVARAYKISLRKQKFSSRYPKQERFRPDVLEFLGELYNDWVADIAKTVREYNPNWLVTDGGDQCYNTSRIVNGKRKGLREGITQAVTQHCVTSWFLFPGLGVGWNNCPSDNSLPLSDVKSNLKQAFRAVPFVASNEWGVFKANGGAVFFDEGIDPYWEPMVPPLLINSRYFDGALSWAWHGSAGHEWANGKDGFEHGRDFVQQFYVNTLHSYPSIIQKKRLYWRLAFTEFCQYEDWHNPAPDVLIILNPQKPNYHHFVVPLVQTLNRSNVSYSTTQIDEFTREELSNFKLIIYLAENQNLEKTAKVFEETARTGNTHFLILGDGSYDDSSANHGCFGPWHGKFFFKGAPSLNRLEEESPQKVQVTSDFFSLKKGQSLNLQRLGYEWIAFDAGSLSREITGKPQSILEYNKNNKKYSMLSTSGNIACLGSVPFITDPKDPLFIDYETIMRAVCRWAGIKPGGMKDYIQIPKANGLGIFTRPEPEGESKVEFPKGIDLVKSIMQFEKVTYKSPVVLKGYDYKILLPHNIDVVGYPYAQKKGVFAISQTNSFKSFEVNEENIKFKTTGPDTTTAEIAVYDIPFPVSSVTLDGKPLSKEESWKMRKDESLLISFSQTEKDYKVEVK